MRRKYKLKYQYKRSPNIWTRSFKTKKARDKFKRTFKDFVKFKKLR